MTSTPVHPGSTGTTPARPVVTRPLVGPRLAILGLVGGAVLNAAESIGMHLLLPSKPETVREQLALVAEHETAYRALAVVGTLAVPLMMIGFLALVREVRRTAPRLGSTAWWLLAAGMWGFGGMHLVSLLQVPFAGSGDVSGAATALAAAQKDPALGLLFLAPFLLGTFVGMIVLAAGLLKTGAVPRWIPLTLLAFLFVDFVLRNPGPVDAHWLWVAACVGAAWSLHRSPRPSQRTLEV